MNVFDGTGEKLAGPDTTTAPSPGHHPSVSIGAAITPTANPIRVLVESPGGNGEPTQTIWDVTWDCPALPPSIIDSEADTAPSDTPAGMTPSPPARIATAH